MDHADRYVAAVSFATGRFTRYFLDVTNVKEMQKTMLLNESEPLVERGLVKDKLTPRLRQQLPKR